MDFSPSCLMCGYSLVGLADGRCPECGQGFTHTELLGQHKANVERVRNSISGWRIFALFIYSLAVLFLLALYAVLPGLALLGFAVLIAVAVREAMLGLRRNLRLASNVLLLFVAGPLLLMGIGLVTHSLPLWRGGYRWTEFDYPTVRGGEWLPPGRGVVLGVSFIAIALAIPAGLYLLWRRGRARADAQTGPTATLSAEVEANPEFEHPAHSPNPSPNSTSS